VDDVGINRLEALCSMRPLFACFVTVNWECSRWRDVGVTDQWLEPLVPEFHLPEVIPVAHDESASEHGSGTMTRKSGGVFYGTFDSHKLKIRPAPSL
jgi:hypothetical protein